MNAATDTAPEATPDGLTAPPPAIEVRGLRTQFGPQVIHDGLDFQVEPGEIMGVVGGSGTGKSVLLRTIIGLIKPAAGRIAVLGQSGRPTCEPCSGAGASCSRTAPSSHR
jgi:ABC-type transporter Mla maintaining outer membrane lipid asymmetry ATPase subunit MlaF